MKIKVALVKELREKTGAGIMDCKKTLVETNGDLQAAIDLMRASDAAEQQAKVEEETRKKAAAAKARPKNMADNSWLKKLHKWAEKNGIGVLELSSLGQGRLGPAINIKDNDDLCFIAWSKYTSSKILEALSKYRHQDVRSAVAGNYNTSAEVLKELANDKVKDVRMSVANNPYTPVESLIKLSREKDDATREYAAVHLPESSKEFERLSKDKSENVRSAVAMASTNPEILKRLAKDESETVREAVAYNSNTPSEILKVLAKDADNN